jgi:PLP dependent protein
MENLKPKFWSGTLDLKLATSVEANLELVRSRIEAAARRVGRDPAEVTLVAVTKTVAPEQIVEAYRLGIHHFGENRVEEAIEKIPRVCALLREYGLLAERPIWHMIGHLQRRKVRDAVSLFDWIHSIDSLRLAQDINKRGAIIDKVIPVLLEVNVAAEPTKYGFSPNEVTATVAEILHLSYIRIEGLMTMAPIVANPEQTRPIFGRLRELCVELRHRYPGLTCQHLSMGMTDDFEPAVEEGATLVRIGRAIFGERPVT